MNLTEAFDVALPEIPALPSRDIPPKVHPKLTGGEHMEAGVPIISALISGSSQLFRFSPTEWSLIQMFDGTHATYDDLAHAYREQTGIECAPNEIREFASALAAYDFWYKTPMERNVTLYQKLKDERQKRVKKKSRFSDVTYISFKGWDPDNFFAAIYPYIRFVYSTWFSVLSVCAVGFMISVWITNWHQYWWDTVQFFNFADKGGSDLIEFYVLGTIVLFIHESAHGLTCKHFGAPCHDMGFHLIYLTPAFYVDATEIYVYGSKWQRIAVVFAGVWSELIIAAVATAIWLGTPPGSWIHEISYKVTLLAGFAVIIMNWNPLIKLDGYYICCQMLEIVDLKENSTAYVSAWFRRTFFRLPVEVPYVPKRQRALFIVYSLLSGVYSYSLLIFFAMWVGNILRQLLPEWSFLVTAGVTYLFFRSRIRAFVRFMRILYLDKISRVKAWFTPARAVICAAAVLIVVFAPLWRDSVEGRFVLEPSARAVVRAAVPGVIDAVFASEGQPVAAGQTIAQLHNLRLESEAAKADADLRLATARASQAQLHYASFGAAERERQSMLARSAALRDARSRLTLTAPIAGVVTTPHLQDWLGSSVKEGMEVAEIANIATMKARLFVPEYEVRKVRLNRDAGLLCDGSADRLKGIVVAKAPVASEMETGLVHASSFHGIGTSSFYAFEVLVDNPDGALKAGMIGSGRIYGPRRSVAGFLWEPIGNLLGSKIW